jgi:hypothetical protein
MKNRALVLFYPEIIDFIFVFKIAAATKRIPNPKKPL